MKPLNDFTTAWEYMMRVLLAGWLGMMMMLLSAAVDLHAQDNAYPPPSGGKSLLTAESMDNLKPQETEAGKVNLSWIQVDKQPFKRALQIEHSLDPSKQRDVRLLLPVSKQIEAADLIYLSFYARVQGRFSVQLRHTGSAYGEVRSGFWMPLEGNGQWMQYRIPFYSDRRWKPGEARLIVAFPATSRVFAIANVQMFDYKDRLPIEKLPPMTSYVTYPGREKEASWRKAAKQRIETHRKADIQVHVENAIGAPLEGAQVQIRMKRHAFAFGSAVNAITWGGATRGAGWPFYLTRGDFNLRLPSRAAQAYQEKIPEFFNEIVIENALKQELPLIEDALEREGVFSHDDGRPWTRDLIRSMKKNNITIRGHYLTHSEDLGSEEAMQSRIEQAVAKLAVLRGTIREWDALNHPVLQGYPSEELLDRYTRFLQAMRKADPDVKLFLNEGAVMPSLNRDWVRRYEMPLEESLRNMRMETYAQLIEYFLEHKVPFDGIGLMGHFTYTHQERWGLTPPDDLLKFLEKFAAYGKPIKVTEYDVQIVDEQLVADYTRDLLTVMFSHPSVVGVLTWGFWDGSHWLLNSPFYRADFSLKPSGKEWKHLVFQEWWTNENGMSDANGDFATRGFLGDYEIRVEYNGESVTRYVPLGKQGIRMKVRIACSAAKNISGESK